MGVAILTTYWPMQGGKNLAGGSGYVRDHLGQSLVAVLEREREKKREMIIVFTISHDLHSKVLSWSDAYLWMIL